MCLPTIVLWLLFASHTHTGSLQHLSGTDCWHAVSRAPSPGPVCGATRRDESVGVLLSLRVRVERRERGPIVRDGLRVERHACRRRVADAALCHALQVCDASSVVADVARVLGVAVLSHLGLACRALAQAKSMWFCSSRK